MHDPQFNAELISEKTWLIEGFDVGANMYLLAGDERAILIDNGYGEHDPRSFAETLCQMPVAWSALTHGHFDHAGGSQFFELVFMSKEAEAQAKEPYPSLAGQAYDFGYPIRYVADGDVIDLGGRRLEVLEIPSHSIGDVAYLDRKSRMLFAGDAAGSHINLMWPQETPQPTVEQFLGNMRKLQTRREDFDWICVGHGPRPEKADCIENLIENAQRVLSGIAGQAPRPKTGPDGKPMQAPPGKGPRPGDSRVYGEPYRLESEWKQTSLGYDSRYIR